MQVRSLHIKAPWQTELRQRELAAPSAGWVRVRVEACGICGTDLSSIQQQAQWGAAGHEVAGVVDAVGPGVDTVAIGTRVLLESSSYCGRCDLCRDGRVDLCRDKVPNFWNGECMGFGDAMLAHEDCLVPYSGLSAAEACLAEPVGVALDLVQTARIEFGESVLLVGPGPIGLAAIALARHRGASRIVAIGTPDSERRLELAKEFGAETIAHAGNLAALKQLHRSFDHVLVTAPTHTIPQAMAFLAYGGELSYVGIGHSDGTISFDANDFHFRKLQLRASYAVPATRFPAVLRLMQAGIVPAGRLISHTFQLSQAAEAFAVCRDRRREIVKVILTP